ncbi:Aconitate hydratase mitochondrial [Rhodotorula kratochvilovae]
MHRGVHAHDLRPATDACLRRRTYKVQNQITGEWAGVPQVGAYYRDHGIGWVVIGDENYARIHETNLKKQGMLPLNFKNPADYDRVKPDDKVDLIGIKELAEGSEVTLRVHHKDGSTEDLPLTHTFNEGQIAWHRAGSALNHMAKAKTA